MLLDARRRVVVEICMPDLVTKTLQEYRELFQLARLRQGTCIYHNKSVGAVYYSEQNNGVSTLKQEFCWVTMAGSERTK